MGDKKWRGENEIKAQLRELTAATRSLRRDLDELMRAPAARTDRRYLHRQVSPAATAKLNDRPPRTKKR